MNGEEEPQGRGVPELIAAYRQGEDRDCLFYEARYLRYLDGNLRQCLLPGELVNALFCARDESDSGGLKEITIPVAIGPDIDVADLAFTFVSNTCLAMLVVLDEHLVLILGGSNGNSMIDAHAWIFDRSREYEMLDAEEAISAPALTHFCPKGIRYLGTGTGFCEEQAASFIDQFLRVIETQRNGEQVVACSYCIPAPVEGWIQGPPGQRFYLMDTYQKIVYGSASTDDTRARGFFAHIIRHLYCQIASDEHDNFDSWGPPGSGSDTDSDEGFLSSHLIPEPGFYRRQRNFTCRIPHVLLHSLVTKARATEPQTRKKTRRFADARLYAFLYGAMPAPIFREVVMFL